MLAVAGLVLLASPALRAVPAADAAAGRALVKQYADAVVGVELVVTLKIKMGDREAAPREQRIEVNGTVISADGLTVASLGEVDPQVIFDAMRGQGGRAPELAGEDFTEVKLRLADGSEVPAKFVLKDSDLDLAFMAPDPAAMTTKREFPHVSLDQSADGALLGSYVFVGRAPKALQRVPMARTVEVTAIVEKPRRFFIVSDQSLGSPLLDWSGKIVGLNLQHFANGRRTAIILPAADIADMAKQAVAAQAAEAKKAAESAAESKPADSSSAK